MYRWIKHVLDSLYNLNHLTSSIKKIYIFKTGTKLELFVDPIEPLADGGVGGPSYP